MTAQRDLWNRGPVLELPCPNCKGSGKHTGPIPYRNCLRCGGFGTVIRYAAPEAPEEDAYDLSDPKHPRHHEVYADHADLHKEGER